ncbi:MAG TPA: diguanylate cyclase, partial [Pyrinomonadaceae bacterium]
MDEKAAQGHDATRAAQGSTEAPQGWADAQDSLAAAYGLSLLLVAGHQPPALAVSNNNSICHAFQSSEDYAHLCEPYCGRAHKRATDAGGPTHYRCHVGLHCFAMPVALETKRKLAVIGGRAFLTSADYRAVAERFRTGDLQDLLSSDLFRNVIFASRQDLEDLSRRVAGTAEGLVKSASKTESASRESTDTTEIPASPASEVAARHEALPPNHEFVEVCGAAVGALVEKQGLRSVALLLRDKTALVPVFASGRFKGAPVNLEFGPKDSRLLLTAKAGSSLPLRETAEGLKPLQALNQSEQSGVEKSVELFPLVVGDEVKGVLLVAEKNLTDAKRRAVSAFCRDNALPFEVLRLRYELEQRARFADLLQTFAEHINAVEPNESYRSILRESVELLHSERGSILLFDESSNELTIKATFGPHTKTAAEARMRLGEGVAGSVLKDGRPLLVRDMETGGYAPAPAERRYKTKSFISYPITIGGRKVGVLNVTDKVNGGTYDELDLGLLETIAPQVALALDRAEWREKAAQFQLMSITDPLTGLLNRRYLEQRLAEEVNRSRRQGYEMCFMMIDIDDFKLYNDLNGHQAGDVALEMAAQCLKSALRSADVASRYGGEEFSILLPQTSPEEAASIAERIRQRVERTRFPHGKSQPLGAVTVSIGVSSFVPDLDTPEKIIGAA